MPKEWILNRANERWGLNKKTSVGPTSLWIRECDPKNIDEWVAFYFNKLETMLKKKSIDLKPEEYISDLGLKLYTKISEVVREEIDEISEDDCVNFVYDLVIRRTYDGYHTEKETVYCQLQDILKVPIKPAPDEWDRLYNVDFFIEINGTYIGLQIKPITYEQTPELYRQREWIKRTHESFKQEFGGRVFIVFSIKKDKQKVIQNPEIINDIKQEIEELQN